MSLARIMQAAGFMLAACAVFAGDLTLTWKPPTNGPAPAGYFLYASSNALPAGASTAQIRLLSALRVDAGTNLQARVESLKAGQWRFVATAYGSGGLESDPSNVFVAEWPEPPIDLRTIIVQFSATLTNFSDVGFFRIKLEP